MDEERKVRLVQWGPHTLHRWKRGGYGWFNGALHKNWMEERKVQLVEWEPYTQHGWKIERYGCLNGDHTEDLDGRNVQLMNGGHTSMNGREKGAAG